MTDALTRRLREQIAERDRAILDAANARLRLVAELKHHKETEGMSFAPSSADSSRSSCSGSANEGVRALFSEILALTKREIADD